MRLMVLLAGMVMGMSGLIRAAEKVELVKEGKSPYVIVISEKAPAPEKRGAEEIQKYVEEMSGAFLPIVTDEGPAQDCEVVVGMGKRAREAGVKADLKELGNDAFLLRTAGKKAFVVGSPMRGTMYGCYELLERMGVRWYTPKVTKAPKQSSIAMEGMDEKHTPAFEYREPFFTEAFEKDWAARTRMNGSNQKLDESTGGKVRFADPFVHSFDKLVPPALYKEHPQYFPLRGGKRKGGYVQRCLTNPDVIKLTVANVRKWMEEQPDAVLFSVSQNDTGEWCECDNCSAMAKKYGGQSGLYVWFANQIAEQIQQEHPDKLIDTLAYQFTEAPPKGMRPRHNVRIRLCPINVCEAHAYEQCNQPANVDFVQRLHAWGRIANTLYIWHYNTDFGHYLMPFPDFAEFPADARMYKRNGVKGIFFQGDYAAPEKITRVAGQKYYFEGDMAPGGGGSDAELRSYVMARLLWNLDVDTDAVVSEWMNGVYGPAAKPMRAWFDLVHAQVTDPKAAGKEHHLFIYDGPRVEIFTEAVQAKGNELFDQAEKLAETDLQKEYVKKNRLPLQYVDIIHHPTVGEKFKQFMADCRAFGITRLNEGRKIDQWEADYVKSHTPKG